MQDVRQQFGWFFLFFFCENKHILCKVLAIICNGIIHNRHQIWIPGSGSKAFSEFECLSLKFRSLNTQGTEQYTWSCSLTSTVNYFFCCMKQLPSLCRARQEEALGRTSGAAPLRTPTRASNGPRMSPVSFPSPIKHIPKPQLPPPIPSHALA